MHKIDFIEFWSKIPHFYRLARVLHFSWVKDWSVVPRPAGAAEAREKELRDKELADAKRKEVASDTIGPPTRG